LPTVNGPPESPLQESRPAAPAQIMLSVMDHVLPQVALAMIGMVTDIRLTGKDPPGDVRPHLFENKKKILSLITLEQRSEHLPRNN
jgi:hypothetical protein